VGPAGLAGALAPITTNTTAATAPAESLHEQLVAQGAKQGRRLPPLTREQSGMALLVLGAFLSYLEYLGMEEAKRALLARPKTTKPPAPPTKGAQQRVVAVDADLMGIDPSMAALLPQSRAEMEQLSARQLRELQRRLASPPKSLVGEEEAAGGDTMGGLAEWLRERLYGLYESEVYYNPSASPNSQSIAGAPLRVLVNLWLGFLAQAQMLGGRRGGKDGLHRLGQLGSLWVYWEVFVYALRLYGWGAVYSSLTLVLRELMLTLPQKSIKEDAAQPRRDGVERFRKNDGAAAFRRAQRPF